MIDYKRTFGVSKEDCKVVCSMDFKDETIIITDPCYITFNAFLNKGKGWPYFLERLDMLNAKSGFAGGIIALPDGSRVMVSDTVYGDWNCRVYCSSYDGMTAVALGQFCADAGLVCVVSDKCCTNDIKNYGTWCWTQIPNFTGTVSIVRYNDICGEDTVAVVGEGSMDFFSVQTV